MRQSVYEGEDASNILLMQDLYDTTENRLLLEAEINGADDGVSVLYAGTEKGACVNLNYADVFSLDAEMVCGIAFFRKWIPKCGWVNTQLRAGELFEFLFRLIKQTGSCKLIFTETAIYPDGDNGANTDGIAHTYAYIMRLHLDHLHKLNLTDAVFSEVCALMQQKDCFAQFQQYMNYFITDAREFERIAGYTAPFVILRGDDTCGGVLQQFADDLAAALAANNEAVVEVGQDEMDYDELQGMLSKGIVGFQTAALEIDFFRRIHGPKFQFWFDNPLRFKNVLRDLSDDYYVLCQDAGYAESIQKYYHTRNAIQFPPGGIEIPDVSTRHTCEDRIYDVVFVGGYFSEDAKELREDQKEYYRYMLAHPMITFEQGLLETEPAMENVFDERFVDRMCELKPACRAVIAHFRKQVITTLLKAGITVHVYGEEWRTLQREEAEYVRTLVIHPFTSMEKSMEEFRKAKIGLNIMSWHKAGMTERVANIMLSGAVCLSEETDYLRRRAISGENLVLFRLDELDMLPGKVRELLEDPERREQIAMRGYQKAVQEFSWNARAKQLIALSEKRLEKKHSLCVFVATHVAFHPPADPIYVPLHVGRYGKTDLGYLGDDTGENISDLNFLYGELTGLYWIWQNVHEFDYVGLCHYRRYFINDARRELREEEYLNLLQEYDAIVPKHAECTPNYYGHFGRAHNIHDLDAVGRALKRSYPEYADAYDRAMANDIFYGGNLVVTSMPILKAYAEWLFTIFLEAGDEIDVSGYDDYHKRVYGFLSEQMFYVYAIKNHLKLCEMTVGICEEKAETRELIDALQRLLKRNQLAEARQLFYSQLETRPDLLLDGSDINHELRDIYETYLK